MPMPNAVVATTTSSVVVHEALLDGRRASARRMPRVVGVGAHAARAQRGGELLGLALRVAT